MNVESTAGTIVLLSIASTLLNFVVLIYLMILASRFVNAFELIADSAGRMAHRDDRRA
ncbi:MAG: hypothetical protein KDA54_19190 [Phycisphaerales bacterium]|nr:hypothetical protein [Phycisphaerales bacterium]